MSSTSPYAPPLLMSRQYRLTLTNTYISTAAQKGIIIIGINSLSYISHLSDMFLTDLVLEMNGLTLAYLGVTSSHGPANYGYKYLSQSCHLSHGSLADLGKN